MAINSNFGFKKSIVMFYCYLGLTYLRMFLFLC